MAIAFDIAATKYVSSGTTNTQTIVPSGSADFLVVFTMVPIARTVSGVTWNSVAMTSIDTQNSTAFKLQAWYLKSPATGSNSLIVTANASTEIYAGALFYSGTNITTQPDVSAKQNNASGTTITQTVTTTVDNAWLACCTLADVGGLASSTGSTTRGSILNTAFGVFDSNSAKSPAGSYSMLQTMNNGNNTGIIIGIKPFVATNNNSSLMFF